MVSSESETTSPSGSDSGSEAGLQDASASAASRASPVQPRSQPYQRPSTTTRSTTVNGNDLQHRLAAIQLQYPPQQQQYRRVFSPSGSSTSRSSSMAVAGRSPSTVSSFGGASRYTSSTAPSLASSRSTVYDQSVKSGSIYQPYRLNRGENDVAELPEQDEDEEEEDESVRLECFFGWIGCREVFEDLEAWDCHCRAHYRRSLPALARCPFPGCGWARDARVNRDAWDERLRHMEDEHDETNYQYPRARPDPAVIEGLRRAGMIDNAQYQELRGQGRLTEQPVLHTASRREEERRRRRT